MIPICSLLTIFSPRHFDTDKFSIRPAKKSFFFGFVCLFLRDNLWQTLFLSESQYMKFPAHPQSTCITWQHKPESSWTPGCHRVPQKSSCLGMGKPPRWIPWRSSKPEELGALGRRTWKVWGSTRLGGGGCRAASLLHRQKREMAMRRQGEKQHLFLSKAGGVHFIHLNRRVCPLCYLSLLPPWWEHPGDLPRCPAQLPLGFSGAAAPQDCISAPPKWCLPAEHSPIGKVWTSSSLQRAGISSYHQNM